MTSQKVHHLGKNLSTDEGEGHKNITEKQSTEKACVQNPESGKRLKSLTVYKQFPGCGKIIYNNLIEEAQ